MRKSITRVDVRIKVLSEEVQRLAAAREKLEAEEVSIESKLLSAEIGTDWNRMTSERLSESALISCDPFCGLASQ